MDFFPVSAKHKPGKGFDQLADVLTKLKTDPNNRRIMMTTFDPAEISNPF